jgi:hypothetical protein
LGWVSSHLKNPKTGFFWMVHALVGAGSLKPKISKKFNSFYQNFQKHIQAASQF